MIIEELAKREISLFEMEGSSYKGYMKIDHIASAKNIRIISATYEDVFKETNIIGVPDHSLIVAQLHSI